MSLIRLYASYVQKWTATLTQILLVLLSNDRRISLDLENEMNGE